MENVLLFTGCSYTYGEGLELYSNNSKWIKQRNYKTHDFELRQIQDSIGTNFRLNNNFPSIVGKHFNITSLQSIKNGGCFANSLRYIRQVQKDITNKKKKIIGIIFQLSSFDREPFHFDYNCRCNMCEGTVWAYWGEFYMHLDYLSNLIENKMNAKNLIRFQKTDKETQDLIVRYFSGIMTKFDNKFNYKNFIQKSLKNKQYFLDVMENITNNMDNILDQTKKEALVLNQKIIEKFEEEMGPVYFIDSWCKSSSKLIFENDFYYDRLIPLKGDDGKYYKKWTSWEKTINKRFIADDFPKTTNYHPSLHSHQIIGNSIINFLNKKPSLEPFLKIRYI
mgnify:CR=1 FL=1|jgi:hypothetical protein